MSRMPREVSNTGLYHVVLKGLNGMALFEEPTDYERFLALLAAALSRTGVMLLSWCLMTNHVHLAVLDQNHSLSKMVHYAAFQYAAYFNRKHGRSGPLYNGRFWSGAISDEGHLLQVVKYIHLNPQRASMATARAYTWSSYREYIGTADITDTSVVMGALETVERFENFMTSSEGPSPVRARGERLSDWQALKVLEECGCRLDASDVLEAQGANQQAMAVVQARRHGVGAKQLHRLTGLSKQVIRQATRRRAWSSGSSSGCPREASGKSRTPSVLADTLAGEQLTHATVSSSRRQDEHRALRKRGGKRLRH